MLPLSILGQSPFRSSSHEGRIGFVIERGSSVSRNHGLRIVSHDFLLAWTEHCSLGLGQYVITVGVIANNGKTNGGKCE